MVHAKAQSTSPLTTCSATSSGTYFRTSTTPRRVSISTLSNYGAGAPNAPHNPIPIPLDVAFADWNPIGAPDQLVEAYYGRAFGALLSFVRERCAEAAVQ